MEGLTAQLDTQVQAGASDLPSLCLIFLCEVGTALGVCGLKETQSISMEGT